LALVVRAATEDSAERTVGHKGQAALGESLRKVEAELAAGRGEQALVLCQEVQGRFPRALAVQRVLGEVYLTLRKQREALGALERALAGDPEDARALCARAIVHQMHGDSAAALAWYRRACDVRPDDPVLRATYRELALHLGQPSYQPTRLGLARLYLRGDLLTHAVREWETLAAEQPGQLEAQVGLAEALWRAGRAQAAEEQCRRILANAPSCIKAHILLAALLLDRKLADEARRHAERATELDPEQRIAQALFADRLAAGDPALATLLLGSPSASRSLAATPRAALPGASKQVLSETEYMLWGPDEETRARAAIAARQATVTNLGPADPAQAAQVDRVASDQVVAPPKRTTGQLGHAANFVPPVLVEQGESMNDSETRKAIGWVQWLQSQGARVHPGMAGSAPGAPPATAPGASGARPTPRPSSSQPAAPPRPAPADRSRHPAVPLGSFPGNPATDAADSTAALRAMFAELDGGARSAADLPMAGSQAGAPGSSGLGREPLYPPDPVPAGNASFGGARGAEPFARSEPSGGNPVPAAWDDNAGRPAGWLAEDAAQPNLLPRNRRETETERLAQAHALSQGHGAEPPPGAAVTLESLERRFAESGFQPVEPQPGLLAAMAAGDSGVTSSLTSSLTSSRAPSYGPERVALPSEMATDYVGRMHLARTWRKEGRLDDALAEYRVLLKQAPDILPELIAELMECQQQAPEHPEVHRLLGDARIQQGDYLGALEAYNRAVALTHPDEL
jgi:tetratricopeptide (TPR) repeat protein